MACTGLFEVSSGLRQFWLFSDIESILQPVLVRLGRKGLITVQFCSFWSSIAWFNLSLKLKFANLELWFPSF